jgi:hypothetical protein
MLDQFMASDQAFVPDASIARVARLHFDGLRAALSCRPRPGPGEQKAAGGHPAPLSSTSKRSTPVRNQTLSVYNACEVSAVLSVFSQLEFS